MARKSDEELKKYRREWYLKNSERLKQDRSSYYYAKNRERLLFEAARQRAKNKNIEFSISLEDIIIPEICPILGEPLVKHTRYAPSIDRKDSSKGYTKENIWVISRRANLMKNDATLEDLRKFAKWAKTFQP